MMAQKMAGTKAGKRAELKVVLTVAYLADLMVGH